MERDEQEQERETDDAGDEQRHAVEDEVALILERRGHAADLGLDAGAAERLRHEVLAQPVDEVLDRGVLRGALGDHGEERRVALLVDARRRDEGDPRLAAQLLRELVDLCLSGRVRQVGGDHERAVGAGPEALGVQVVSLPGHGARRVVAGVGEAQAHVERGHRQREQHQRRRDRGEPGPALDGVAPPPRERPLAARLLRQAPAEEGQPPAVDLRAEVGEERGQQRDRGEHHDEDRERGGDGDAVHVGQPGQGEAED